MTHHYGDFSRRWGIIGSNKSTFDKLKSGIINILIEHLSSLWCNEIDEAFCKLAYVKYVYQDYYKTKLQLGNAELSLAKSRTPSDLFFYLEILLNIFYRLSNAKSPEEVVGETYDLEGYDDFDENEKYNERCAQAYKHIMVDLKQLLSVIPTGVTFSVVNGEILFYPEGAKLLDEKVISDVLDWLSEYKKSYLTFKSALEKYEKKIYKRNLLDDLRSSLELFLREFLHNEKSLEKQGTELLGYLEKQKISKEIRFMFWTLIDRYSKYQNEYVKHDDNVNEKEVELIIYLTGTFIRFLINLERGNS